MLIRTLVISIRERELVQRVYFKVCKELRLERVYLTDLQKDQSRVWFAFLFSLWGQRHST